MNIKIIETGSPSSMQPVSCTMSMSQIKIAGTTLDKAIVKHFNAMTTKKCDSGFVLSVCDNVWPSSELVQLCEDNADKDFIINHNDTVLIWNSQNGEQPKTATELTLDTKTRVISHSWDLIDVNSDIVGALTEDLISGTIRNGATIDGNVIIGEGTVILPGVYIEGNAFIGENCKIGPNCYIRGNTYIGNNCHIGQSVEIKNCLIMDKVNVGHLSYVGDSVICDKTNFGAGTTTANLRHDGKNMQSRVDGEMVDTGRRKMGVICGEDVHTGINTSIYPARKIWAGKSTLPGDIVRRDIGGVKR